jgi:hypothetical protein
MYYATVESVTTGRRYSVPLDCVSAVDDANAGSNPIFNRRDLAFLKQCGIVIT